MYYKSFHEYYEKQSQDGINERQGNMIKVEA